MTEKVMHYMKQHHMIEENDHVIAGVSGGADSVCLFLVLLELRERMGFTMSVVHVEHGIRGEESLRDADFVKKLADTYGIDCTVYACPVPELARQQGLSLEEAARGARYDAFKAQALKEEKRYGIESRQVKIAVAHHREDQAETMLFHLCRGSGIDGLKGMHPVRGNIIRPFLCVSRQEIEGYLKEINQDFCQDATNDSRDYSRNFIRHEILPGMGEINPRSVSHMAKTAEELSEIADYLEEQTQAAFIQTVKEEKDGKFFCDTEKLNNYPRVIVCRVLKMALKQAAGSSKNISREHVNALEDLIRGRVGRRISLPYRLTAERTYDGIGIFPETKEHIQQENVFGMLHEEAAIREEGEEIYVPGGKIRCYIWKNVKKDLNFPKNQYTKWLDYDKIKNGLLFRSRKSGDYITIDAMGHKKKLKEFFIHEKVPRDYRSRVVLAADGSHIVWAVGYRMSEEYKVTADTRRILQMQWTEDKDE